MRQRHNRKLKASLAFVLTLTMLLGILPLTAGAFDRISAQTIEPGSPNIQPGNGVIYYPQYDLTFTVTGGGNNLVFSVTHAGVTEIIEREGNGTFEQTVSAFGFTALLK